MQIKPALTAFLSALALLVVMPAAASATRYVDDTTGIFPPCGTLAAPCASIADGIASSVTLGETIQVDGGSYNPPAGLVIAQGRTLLGQDFVGANEGSPIVDGPAGAYAITLGNAGAPSTLRGMTVRSPYGPVSVAVSGGIVEGNTFDEDTPPSFTSADVVVNTGPGSIVRNNTFIDPNAAGDQTGVSFTSNNGVVSGNTFTGFQTGVRSDFSQGMTIASNTVTGTHNALGQGNAIALGPTAGTTFATITGNTISGSTDSSFGISVSDFNGPGGTTVTAEITHNRISGNGHPASRGISIGGASPAVSLGDNLIQRWGTGVSLSPVGTGGDAEAENLTLTGNTNDFVLSDPDLTLDSSYLSSPISTPGAASNCAITFSRGPAAGSAPSGCDAFSATAGGLFVGEAAGDVNLLTGSPLIDQGNPATSVITTDLSGGPRQVAGTCGSTARRDIGAEEFAPTCTAVTPATPPVKAKKCKKKKKKKKRSLAAAKKKCKKKKKKKKK